MDKLTILDLPNKLKVARNHGVLGNYKEALNHYLMALNLIVIRIDEVDDKFLKEKWKVLESEIKSEVSQCQALYNLCNLFKVSVFDPDIKQQEIIVTKKEINKEINLNNKEENKKDKNNFPERFGGKAPFNVNKNENNIKDKDYINFTNDNREIQEFPSNKNYLEKKENKENKEFKNEVK